MKILLMFFLAINLISCGGSGGDPSPVPGGEAPGPAPMPIPMFDTGPAFSIATSSDDINGIADAGSVIFVNPETGEQVGPALTGSLANEGFGSERVTVLQNGNFVITSNGQIGGLFSPGSVILVSRSTRLQIGAAIVGDTSFDSMGSGGIIDLGNGNFVVSSPSDSVGGVSGAGSIILINGTTGAQVGQTITGDSDSTFLGGSGVIALSNGNFAVATEAASTGALSQNGSVILVDGLTGLQIGSSINGDNNFDFFGSGGLTALSNGNFVISSAGDEIGGLTEVGSVTLVNGLTGAQIGSAITGDSSSDLFSSSGITALGNGNFVIASANDSVSGISNSGSVIMVNGTTGVQIGGTISGDNTNDRIGSSGVTALSNGNYTVSSALDNTNTLSSAGSVMLIDGLTGNQIGGTIFGDANNDFFGSEGVTALNNGNFVIASGSDNSSSVNGAGSVTLVNGSTGAVIGTPLTGDEANDRLGFTSVTALNNGNYVIASQFDDVGGVSDAGSVTLVNGSTGVQIGSSISGDSPQDQLGVTSITALNNGNYVIASQFDDVDGVVDAGSVMLVNGLTGVQIGGSFSGDDPNDELGSSGVSVF